jgi:hypothetical protein
MATSNFTVSSLGEYIKEVSSTILSQAYFGKEYINYFDIMEGQKGKQKLNYFENTLGLYDDACGWLGTGLATSFSQREIDVTPLRSEGAFCVKDLERKWLGQLLKKGSTYTEYPFEAMIVDDMKKQLAKMVENLLFNGQHSAVTGTYLDLADGLIHLLSHEINATGVTSGTTTGTTTITNVSTKVDELINLAPMAIKDKNLIIFTSVANYLLYVQYLFKANLFHATAAVSMNFEIQVPWAPNVKIVGVESITGDDYILTVENNFVMACDSRAEMEDIVGWYDILDDNLKFRAKFKLGVQVYFPHYVVTLGI